MSQNKSVEHEGFEYFKEAGKWQKKSSFFVGVYDVKDEDVPDFVKDAWEETAEKTDDCDSQRCSSSASDSNKVSAKKVNRSKRAPAPDPRLAARQHPISSDTVETINKGGHSPLLVTESEQLIRPLRAELKIKNPEVAQELAKRMEIRKNIMDKTSEKRKAFEPKKKATEESVDARNEVRLKLAKRADEMVKKLEQIKRQRQDISARVQGENEYEPKSKMSKLDRCFEIGQLANVATEHNLIVFNLDKFICATDEREVIYNEKGQCIFCNVHGVQIGIEERHQIDDECPYLFCACANCWLVGELALRGRFIESK